MLISRRDRVNLSTPNFWQHESDRNSDKFIFLLQRQSKIVEIISVYTKNPLRLDSQCGFNLALSGF